MSHRCPSSPHDARREARTCSRGRLAQLVADAREAALLAPPPPRADHLLITRERRAGASNSKGAVRTLGLHEPPSLASPGRGAAAGCRRCPLLDALSARAASSSTTRCSGWKPMCSLLRRTTASLVWSSTWQHCVTGRLHSAPFLWLASSARCQCTRPGTAGAAAAACSVQWRGAAGATRTTSSTQLGGSWWRVVYHSNRTVSFWRSCS